MPALFNLIERESEPSVRAVLGHWLFGYMHPSPDGNGRMARFLMNAILASGGYRGWPPALHREKLGRPALKVPHGHWHGCRDKRPRV